MKSVLLVKIKVLVGLIPLGASRENSFSGLLPASGSRLHSLAHNSFLALLQSLVAIITISSQKSSTPPLMKSLVITFMAYPNHPG